MRYTPTFRKISSSVILAFIAASAMTGIVNEPKMAGLIWPAVVIGAAALGVALCTQRKPRRDAILFAVSLVSSGVYMGATTVGFPNSPPIWLWSLGTTFVATVALYADAEEARTSQLPTTK